MAWALILLIPGLFFGGVGMALAGFPWRSPREPRLRWIFLAVVPPVVIELWGQVWKTPQGAPRSDWVATAIWVFLLIATVLAGALVWKMRDYRWFAAGVCAVMLGLSLFLAVGAAYAIGPKGYFS
jgi:hypothetical protein